MCPHSYRGWYQGSLFFEAGSLTQTWGYANLTGQLALGSPVFSFRGWEFIVGIYSHLALMWVLEFLFQSCYCVARALSTGCLPCSSLLWGVCPWSHSTLVGWLWGSAWAQYPLPVSWCAGIWRAVTSSLILGSDCYLPFAFASWDVNSQAGEFSWLKCQYLRL